MPGKIVRLNALQKDDPAQPILGFPAALRAHKDALAKHVSATHALIESVLRKLPGSENAIAVLEAGQEDVATTLRKVAEAAGRLYDEMIAARR